MEREKVNYEKCLQIILRQRRVIKFEYFHNLQ